MYQQQSFRSSLLATALSVYGAPVSANINTWDFDKATQKFEKSRISSPLTADGTPTGKTKADKRLHLTSADGVNLTVRGYSDTRDVARGDDMIKTGKIAWASETSLGIRNKDETTAGNNRATDSVATGTADPDGDFDMMLLEFDTAVSLSGLQLEWAQGGGAVDTADISILAYSGEGSTKLVGNTWGQTLGNGTGDAYDLVGNYSNVNLSYYSVNPNKIMSTRWLIGVYNPVFGEGGDAANDGFKLANIETFTASLEADAADPIEIPAPGTLALVFAGMFALRARRHCANPGPPKTL